MKNRLQSHRQGEVKPGNILFSFAESLQCCKKVEIIIMFLEMYRISYIPSDMQGFCTKALELESYVIRNYRAENILQILTLHILKNTS